MNLINRSVNVQNTPHNILFYSSIYRPANAYPQVSGDIYNTTMYVSYIFSTPDASIYIATRKCMSRMNSIRIYTSFWHIDGCNFTTTLSQLKLIENASKDNIDILLVT